MGKPKSGIFKLFQDDESGVLKAKFVREHAEDIIIDWLSNLEELEEFNAKQVTAEVARGGKVDTIWFAPKVKRSRPKKVDIPQEEPPRPHVNVRQELMAGYDEPGFNLEDFILSKRPWSPDKRSLKPDNMELVAPKDTRNSLTIEDIDNFALQFYKFPVDISPNDSNVPEFKLYQTHQDDKTKVYKIQDQLGNSTYREIISTIQRRHQRIQQYATAFQWHSFSLRLIKPLIIGLGTTSVYENGIQLHHIYGVPLLSGSSIKGLTRVWLEKKLSPDHIGIHQAVLDQLFGDQSKMGFFTFLDSFPDLNPLIEYDIINVHFPRYFNETDTPPTDDQSPIPISLPRVAVTDHSGKKNQTFTFYIGRNKARKIDSESLQRLAQVLEKPSDPIAFIQSVMQSALREMGIGAKTALGYGRMIN